MLKYYGRYIQNALGHPYERESMWRLIMDGTKKYEPKLIFDCADGLYYKTQIDSLDNINGNDQEGQEGKQEDVKKGLIGDADREMMTESE